MPQPGTLNVILHGTIVYQLLRDEENRITRINALIPQFAEHVVRAGNWLAETTLQRNDYTLTGVNLHPLSAAYDFPEREKNLVFPGQFRVGLTPGDPRLYARIDLGRPNRVRSLRRSQIGPGKFYGVDSGTLATVGTQIASIQVFIYHFEDDMALRLEDHLWEPVFTDNDDECGEDKTTVNLHIFAEHERPYGISEFLGSINACVNLFQTDSRDIDLRFNLPAPSFTIKGNVPDGVATEEMEALVSRTRRLERLGRLQKDHVPALIDQLWFDFDPADPDRDVCGGGRGG